MSLGPSEELRFYGNLLKNNLFGAKYDLHKIPGPPSYWLAGARIVDSRRCAPAPSLNNNNLRMTPHPAGHIPYLLRHDYHIQALEWANKYGGICKFSLGGQHIILVSGAHNKQQQGVL